MQKNGLILTSLCCYTYHDNDNPTTTGRVRRRVFGELHIELGVNKLRAAVNERPDSEESLVIIKSLRWAPRTDRYIGGHRNRGSETRRYI